MSTPTLEQASSIPGMDFMMNAINLVNRFALASSLITEQNCKTENYDGNITHFSSKAFSRFKMSGMLGVAFLLTDLLSNCRSCFSATSSSCCKSSMVEAP